jgi:uncharacterized protein (DUF2147 family)
MRRLLLTLAGLSTLAGPALAADPAEGVWLVQDGKARVRIAPCASQAAELCGDVVWLQNPNGKDGKPRRDENNPDARMQARPLMGLAMIRDFRAAGPGRWEGGTIYDPKAGKTYASKMRVMPGGALKVEGCVMMICKAQTWTRVE